MTFTKSILLGAAAALTGVAAAQAADLPSRKSGPVEYVRVCDAYGAGFFFIPGTDTCLKIGGRVRADYAVVPAQAVFVQPTALAFAARSNVAVANAANPPVLVGVAPAPGTRFNNASSAFQSEGSQHVTGWEARARIEFDARTNTAWGVVRTVAALRLARTTGVLAGNSGAQSASAGPTLETAYVQFAGFTFGAARDNFAFMPSRLYGAGHWGSFANGAKQLAYTHVFAGGFSATLAIQDPVDTTVGAYDYTWRTSTIAGFNILDFASRAPTEVAKLPQLNGLLQLQQGWGEAALAGAFRKIDAAATAIDGVPGVPRFEADANAWAIGTGLKFNLPQLAAGDAIWLTAAYANGMTEYTTNWSSFKSSAYRRDVGGAQINHPSFVYVNGPNGTGDIATVKSWNVAGLMDHYWTPTWRSTFMASYGKIKAPEEAKSCAAGLTATNPITVGPGGGASTLANGCFGDATVWNVATQLTWLPTRNFEVGVEVLYARTIYTMPTDGSGIASSNTTDRSYLGCLDGAIGGEKCSKGNFTGRLRVERTF